MKQFTSEFANKAKEVENLAKTIQIHTPTQNKIDKSAW